MFKYVLLKNKPKKNIMFRYFKGKQDKNTD